MEIVSELRKIAEVAGENAMVGLTVRVMMDGQPQPLPGQSQVFVQIKDGFWNSYFVNDDEWQEGNVASNIIDHMRPRLNTERFDIDG